MNRLMSKALYNDIEPFTSRWLENLIAARAIEPGVVLTKSIADLWAEDVRRFTRAHFFAGIGGWSYALDLASYPREMPVWTGSCPCQPFSSAGLRNGTKDERHLWPEWYRLIQQCKPPVVFGEQVASADGIAWLDAVSADLEAVGYAFGAQDLCAAGVGAPHGRQRLYFAAVLPSAREHYRLACRRMADAARHRAAGEVRGRARAHEQAQGSHEGYRRAMERNAWPLGSSNGREGHRSFWATSDLVVSGDGKQRPIEPGTLPVADGAPQDMDVLRAYGNAIVPQVAATFIEAVMAWLSDRSEGEGS